jgi:cell division inhibitor SepF
MNIFKKLMNGVNPDDEEPFEDVFNDDEIYGGGEGSFGNNAGDISDFMQSNGAYSPYGNQGQGGSQGGQNAPQQPQQAPLYQQPPAPSAAGGALTVAAGVSMQYSAEIKLVKPEDYGQPNQIADHVINRRTVILNMEDTPKETARRLLDYLNGVAYAIGGQVKRVSEKTFAIAPNTINISAEKGKEETRKDSDSNESIY